uniref:Uncharacterized protein n=1 Tax=Desertifilum tharense IPPAS B-1220 TaxID=1781255 RepID=A0ACD5GXV8_9CYAN
MGKKGVGNWELGVREEEDGGKKGVGNWELGVREEEDGGMGGNLRLNYSLPTQHSALSTLHLEETVSTQNESKL